MFKLFGREKVSKEETSPYRGENLDHLLIDKFGFKRGEEETDVEFIKRIFVDLCRKLNDPLEAVEILFGKKSNQYDDQEKDVFNQLMVTIREIRDERVPGPQRNIKIDSEFKKFAESFLGE